MARRYLALSWRLSELDGQLERLVAQAAHGAPPAPVSLHGAGTDNAATSLVAAGDNPERMRNEASFAKLRGVVPMPASSGKGIGPRPSRYGNSYARGERDVLEFLRGFSPEPTSTNSCGRAPDG